MTDCVMLCYIILKIVDKKQMLSQLNSKRADDTCEAYKGCVDHVNCPR